MTTIVITGSTGGIGFGLARAFLARGCGVVVSGRSEQSVAPAVRALGREADERRVLGVPCRVETYAEVEALWQRSVERFGKIDVWISNAGISNEGALDPFWKAPSRTLADVCNTNLLGSMNSARVALAGFIAQGHGQLYNFEGFGSNGKMFRTGLAPYGATKSALRYLTKALAKEVAGTNVKVCALSPGIVVTDLLLAPYEGRPDELEKAKKVFNILADRVETVAPYLAERVLQNDKNGRVIAWLSSAKVLKRFATASFNKRDLFKEADASPIGASA